MKLTHLSKLSLAIMAASISAANAEELYLDTLTVTGQKIERNQQETLDSVELYDWSSIEDNSSAFELYDFFEQSPNVSRFSNDDYSIRGISSEGPTGADEGGRLINVYIDGAAQTTKSSQAGAMSVWDVEQIEILRGPQSTTQGRNALAGAVIVKTKDPEFVSNGRARLLYGQANTYQAAVAQTGPISEKIAYRIAVDRQHSDGFIDNKTLDDQAWNENISTTVRGKLLYEVDQDSKLIFSASDISLKDYGDDSVQEDPFEREAYDNYESAYLTDVNNYSLKFDKQLSDQFSVTSTTAYVKSTYDRSSDADVADSYDFSGVLHQDTQEDYYSQEFLFSYEDETFRSMLGVYFAGGGEEETVKFEDYTLNLNALLQGYGLPLTIPGGDAAVIGNLDSEKETSFDNYAVFANVDYSLTDDLTIIAGLRYDQESRSTEFSSAAEQTTLYDPILGLPAVIGGQPVSLDFLLASQLAEYNGEGEGAESFSVLLPKLGFNYSFNEHISTGLTVQRGYRAGGVSVNVIRGDAQEFDAESTTNYELAFRSMWLENKLMLNANVFHTDWKNQQVSVRGDGGAYDTYIENAAESQLSGFELSSRYQMSLNFIVSAGVGYVETEFNDFEVNGSDFSGNEFGRAPDWTANVGTTYRGGNGFFANARLNYVGSAYMNETNTTESDPYAITNTKIGYEKNQWSVYMYANNLFDRDYITRIDDRSANVSYEVGDPRVVGLVGELYW